jgi:hypothetical protein
MTAQDWLLLDKLLDSERLRLMRECVDGNSSVWHALNKITNLEKLRETIATETKK